MTSTLSSSPRFNPPESLLPSDYAAAAYTAFECGDQKQAAAILTTGVGSFLDDADFALRAGETQDLPPAAELVIRCPKARDERLILLGVLDGLHSG